MSESMTHLIRGLSLAALLMAGSCAAPTGDGGSNFVDGAVNNPILVEPSSQALKLSYSPAGQGLSTTDAARLSAFIDGYRDHGNGSIVISAPSGVSANATIAYFAEQINAMGIPRDHIIVTTHEMAQDDTLVDLNYVTYTAHTNTCGTWTEDLTKTGDNTTAKNFGCANQQNIAAMVSDPRDLLGPRPMDTIDAGRRTAVIGHYEKGEVTQATKHSADSAVEQSAGASTVGGQ